MRKETPSSLEKLLSSVQGSEPRRAEMKRPGADAGKSRGMDELGRKSPAAGEGKKAVRDRETESKRGKGAVRR